jgi:hypothetical protein
MRFKDHTSRSTTNYEYKYPQVGKPGVDAVHESCPQIVYIIKRIVICNITGPINKLKIVTCVN